MMGDKNDANDYSGISPLSAYHSFIQYPCLKFKPIIDEIIGDHQWGFRLNRSTTIFGKKNSTKMIIAKISDLSFHLNENKASQRLLYNLPINNRNIVPSVL
jgi:hypothetical protein